MRNSDNDKSTIALNLFEKPNLFLEESQSIRISGNELNRAINVKWPWQNCFYIPIERDRSS